MRVTRSVIDASAAAEYLLHTSLGLEIADVIEDAILLAPELLNVEVLSVLRRAVLRRKLDERRAVWALEDLADWQIDQQFPLMTYDSYTTYVGEVS